VSQSFCCSPEENLVDGTAGEMAGGGARYKYTDSFSGAERGQPPNKKVQEKGEREKKEVRRRKDDENLVRELLQGERVASRPHPWKPRK